MTNDTVPSFSECSVINATRCSILVSWDLNTNLTIIVVDGENSLSKTNTSDDTVSPMVLMEQSHGVDIPLIGHSLEFSCTSLDKCNNELNLKYILSSLVIEDKFVQELLPLIQVVSPFVPQSAGCYELNNSTSYCPQKDLAACQRCQILDDRYSPLDQEVCATCPRDPTNKNLIARYATFIFKNRTQTVDHIQLDCQNYGCNSIDNVKRIHENSKLTFDFDKFFNNPLIGN